MKNILDIEQVTCGYKNGFRIENIHFSLPKKIFAGIIGPNGSGKTTLFRGISGDLPLKKGNIYLDGRNLSMLTLREKAQQLSFVTQFMEPVTITAEEFVLMGRLPYRTPFQFFYKKEDIEIAHHYMHLTNTYRLRNQSMSELSGGEKQMVSIASALSQKPRLLLLDEPTSHLDITHQVQFMNLLQRLNHQFSLSVVMIVHDLTLAGEYCNYLVLLKEGKIFCEGAPDKVLTEENIRQVYNTSVIVKKNPLSGKPVVFPVSEEVLERQNGRK